MFLPITNIERRQMDNRKDIQEPHDKPASGLRHCQGSDTSCPSTQWAPPHDEIHGTQAPVGGIRTPSSATQMTPHAEWHPAFRTSVELDLEADADKLMFYPERVLNSQSLIIDMLIIRRVSGAVLTADIAALFRDFNIMEYKPSGLNIRGFLQGMGYACQSVTYGVMDVPDVSRSQDGTGYRQASDESKLNGVDPEPTARLDTADSYPSTSHPRERKTARTIVPFDQITLSYITASHPRKLMEYFHNTGYPVTMPFPGIYYVEGLIFPIQIIVQRELDPGASLWLSSLRKNIPKEQLKLIADRLSAASHITKDQYKKNLFDFQLCFMKEPCILILCDVGCDA